MEPKLHWRPQEARSTTLGNVILGSTLMFGTSRPYARAVLSIKVATNHSWQVLDSVNTEFIHQCRKSHWMALLQNNEDRAIGFTGLSIPSQRFCFMIDSLGSPLSNVNPHSVSEGYSSLHHKAKLSSGKSLDPTLGCQLMTTKQGQLLCSLSLTVLSCD